MTDYRIALIGTGRVGYQFNFGKLPDNHAAAVLRSRRGSEGERNELRAWVAPMLVDGKPVWLVQSEGGA